MAIAFDATAGRTTANPVSTVSHSHTCTGDNRILFALGRANSTGGILTATYNGVAMTAIATVSSTYKLTLFYLIAPASGNNTLQLSWDGAATRLVLSSVSYTGAKQSSQPDAFNTGTDTTSPFQVSVTTVADNCWTVGAFVDNTDAVMTVGTGTTNRAGSGAVSDVLADSNAAKTPAGSVTLECTGAGGGGLQIGASFKPYVAPTSSAFLLF